MQRIEKFAQACFSPEQVQKTALGPSCQNPNLKKLHPISWYDLSLVDGYGALVLFYSSLDQKDPLSRFDLTSHLYVLKLKEELEKSGLTSNLSLFSGAAGLCFALRFASKGYTRYQKMISVLEELFLNQITDSFLPFLKSRLKEGKPLHFQDYDLIQGFSGVGLFLLQNREDTKKRFVLERFLELAVQITLPIYYRGHIVPGWVTPPEYYPQSHDVKKEPDGIFNMGLAHGIPALLGFMGIAWKAQVRVAGQKEAMERIIKWLKARVTSHGNTYFFRGSISFAEEVTAEPFLSRSLSNREAWCYGSPGTLRAMYLAANAIDDVSTISFIQDVFYSLFDRDYATWKLAGPTFCHGFSGVLLITYLMARDLKSSFLEKKVRELEEKVLAFYQEDDFFGFPHFDLCQDLSYFPLPSVSLLTGSTGVFLSLLTTKYELGPKWYHLFMLDYV